MIENIDDFVRYKRISEKYYKLFSKLINRILLKDRREIVKDMGLSLDFRSLNSDYKDIFYEYLNEHENIVPMIQKSLVDLLNKPSNNDDSINGEISYDIYETTDMYFRNNTN